MWLGVQDDEMENTCHRGLRGRMTNINAPPPGLLLNEQAPNPWARFWALSEIRGLEFQNARSKGCQLPEIRYPICDELHLYELSPNG
jgi:hypothetical protein